MADPSPSPSPAAGRVFVGKLPLWVGEDELLAAFPAALQPHDACVVRDRRDGASRGFGFVTVCDAARAVRECQGLAMQPAADGCVQGPPRRLIVSLAIPNPTAAPPTQAQAAHVVMLPTDSNPHAAPAPAPPAGPDRAIPVGAVVCGRGEVDQVLCEARRLGWCKRQHRVTPYNNNDSVPLTGPLKAVHLNPTGVAALTAADTLGSASPALAALLDAGRAVWCPGVRAGAAACRAAPQPSQDPPAPTSRDGEEEEGGGAVFTFIELFAGIGGFRVGLEAVGGRCVFASELDRDACTTYEANFGERPHGDITEIEAGVIPDHHVLTAGFPCQSFTRAGDQRGLADARGTLFFEVLRVLEAKTPPAFLLENVANLVAHDGGRTLAVVLSSLARLGYAVEHRTINARALVPQSRDRVYIIGVRHTGGDRERPSAPFPWPAIPVLDRRLGHVLEAHGLCADPGPQDGRDSPATSTAWLDRLRLTPRQMAKLAGVVGGRDRLDGRVARLDGPARTLVSHYRSSYFRFSEFVRFTEAEAEAGAGGEECGDGLRFFSPRELCRLQGFPEAFRLSLSEEQRTRGVREVHFNRLYSQVGNSVAPPVIAAVGAALLEALPGGHGGERRPPPADGLPPPELQLVAASLPAGLVAASGLAAQLEQARRGDGPVYRGVCPGLDEARSSILQLLDVGAHSACAVDLAMSLVASLNPADVVASGLLGDLERRLGERADGTDSAGRQLRRLRAHAAAAAAEEGTQPMSGTG